MWSDEQLNDAIKVLLHSSGEKCVQKVEDRLDDGSQETYLVVGDVTYTDPLYIEALESLVKKGQMKATGESTEKGRKSYVLVGS